MQATHQSKHPFAVELLGALCLLLAWQQPAAQAAAAPSVIAGLDFASGMQPIPASAAFRDPGYYVWCGTMVQDNHGQFHLFYSRWKQNSGPNGWLTYSEVAHAVGTSATGVFTFRDVSLPPRGAPFWDGTTTHNPTVKRFGSKYYLYYMGNTGDRKVIPGLNFTHRNNQRIGVAVADSPDGPWKRSSRPLIDVSADPAAPDSLAVTNPSLTQGRDGHYYLLYKAVGRRDPLPFGGPVVHLMAIADSPTGPFIKDAATLFTVPGSTFPFEDPFFWFDRRRDRYFVILKDMKGVVSGLGHATLVLYQSTDAKNWEPSPHLLVSDLVLHWRDRPAEGVSNLERPQLFFGRDGEPDALLAAVQTKVAGTLPYNVRIPLAWPHR
ncbi:hypothetical protein BH10ACI4_BH10ACI4_07500 [soil metagenome]